MGFQHRKIDEKIAVNGFFGNMQTLVLVINEFPAFALIEIHQGSLAIPCSLATLATGFLMLITRRKALTQALGYLILENGIYVFGVLLAEAMPFMVEAGVLLDLLVAIFIMGIMVNQISRTFSSLNMQNLSSLRE